MDYPIKFGDQLKQQLRSLRKARGLNQTELGVRLGVTQRRIAEIEANPSVVAIDQIIKIFSALGAELVLRDLSPPSSHSPTSGAAADAQAQHEFSVSLVQSARHLMAVLQGNPRQAPEALLVRNDNISDLDSLLPRDKARLIDALAKALLVNPRTLESHLADAPASASESADAPVPPIQAQWARALSVSPEALRQAVRAVMPGRRSPVGLDAPPSKGVW
jgi:HTH-type transcriptional regulator/antitoxin HipB